MGQLFLWSPRIDESLVEEFSTRFGFDLPEAMLEFYEGLPAEIQQFLGFYPLPVVVAEENRPPAMMPGLVPFGEDAEGDFFCYYTPWKDSEGQVPIGIWMHETGHFLPLSSHARGFLTWWLTKEIIDSVGGEDWPEVSRILEMFKGATGLDDPDVAAPPPLSALAWNTEQLNHDANSSFALTFMAANQFAVQGFEASLDMLARAEKLLPFFGAPSLWRARLNAMRGRMRDAHRDYWRHLRTPLFANGYHYWWHAGDLQISETSELEAVSFFDESEIKPPAEILNHPKVSFLRTCDPCDYGERLRLARDLERIGDLAGALVERENAFFLQCWDEKAAREILESLVAIYPKHNRLREAEQCRRAIAKLRHGERPRG